MDLIAASRAEGGLVSCDRNFVQRRERKEISSFDRKFLPLTLYVPGGADLPTLTQTHNFLKIPLCKPILRFVDFSCMSITVLLQKTRASYVPRFNFGGLFFDKKFGVQIANVQKISIFAKNQGFSKKSQGYSFQRRGLCF